MADKLAIFKEVTTGKQIAINPHLVRYVSQINDNDVLICFDKEHIIVVQGTFAEVVDHLEKAAK